MIEIRKYNELGHAEFGWLDARHHFSFGSYYDPQRMGFGNLRVINDDTIAAGRGFELHPHKDMEIITYVREGAITHKDNQGNEGRTEAGNVQVMSAGTGIYHSEHNLESQTTRLYQIWIEPNRLKVEPRWDMTQMPLSNNGGFELLVDGSGDAPLFIHADAEIYVANASAGSKLEHALKRNAYALISQGRVEIDGTELSQGDAAQTSGQASLEINALEQSEILLIEVD